MKNHLKIQLNNDLLNNLLYSFLLLAFFVLFISLFIKNNSYISILIVPLILTSLISNLIVDFGYKKLNNLKIKQIIQKNGPEQHQIKVGTPTMGGIFLIPIALIIINCIYWKSKYYHDLIPLIIVSISFMLIGIADDWSSLTKQTNNGLSPKKKIILQTIAAIIFLILANSHELISTKILLFNNEFIDVGFFIWPLALFVLIAESNATNLTDGLDGLASGCGALIFTGLGIQIILRENIAHFPIAGFCMAMAGTWLGFLAHNKHPAKIFMGDSGSLAMGAALAGVSLITNSLWVLFIMGGIFLVESLSVIFQVIFFKITKKLKGKGHRIFRMAPLHHHFELQGVNEISIVRSFWLTTMVLVISGILLRPNLQI